MTQRLALDLSEEWAALLRLEDDEWHLLGRTALSGEDLHERLSVLLQPFAAPETPPELLVSLPADQMTYASLPLHEIGETEEDPTPALKESLAAKYPYLSGDMALDWDLQSGWFLVAVTPRVVLQEATIFIRECGVVPTAFTARPEPGQFPDQPVLGGLAQDAAARTPWPELPDPSGMTIAPVVKPVVEAAPDPDPAPPAAIEEPKPEDIPAAEIDPPSEDPAHQPDPETPEPEDNAAAEPEAPAVPAPPKMLIDDLEVTDRHLEIEQRATATMRRQNLTPSRKILAVAAMTGVLVIGLAALSFWPGQAPDAGEDPDLILSEAIALDPAAPVNTDVPEPIAEVQEDATGDLADLSVPEALPDEVEAEAGDPEALPLPEDLTVFYSPSPILTQEVAEQDLLDVVYPGIDPSFRTDALALPQLVTWDTETLPKNPQTPGPAEQIFVVDDRGLVRPSADGTLTPDGILVFSGTPDNSPPQRPDRVEPEVISVLSQTDLPDDHPLKGVAPRVRPQGLDVRAERATLGGKTRAELATFRPTPRPVSAQEQQAVEDAPATELALTLAQSPRPKPRSRQAAERFAKAAAATPAAPIESSQVAAPSAASPKNVARDATQGSGLNLSQVNLLGTFGPSRSPRALVRMPSGQVVKVSVGDRMDGGRVSEIRQGQLRYVKSGRNVTLTMPRG